MLDFFKKRFKGKDLAEEILKDLEESQKKYEKLRKEYKGKLEEWKRLSEKEREEVKSMINLRFRVLEDDLKSLRIRVLHFLLTFVLGFAVVNLYFMYYYVKNKGLTESMVLFEVFFSLLFILTFLYYLVGERKLFAEIYKYFVLSEEMRKMLESEEYAGKST